MKSEIFTPVRVVDVSKTWRRRTNLGALEIVSANAICESVSLFMFEYAGVKQNFLRFPLQVFKRTDVMILVLI